MLRGDGCRKRRSVNVQPLDTDRANIDNGTVALNIGIIGGTGIANPDILENQREKDVDTPYGKPSDKLICGTIGGVECALLARHGRGHTILPSDVNYRANVWAMKQEGCTHLLVTTACGSLREDIHPGDIAVLDQFIDRTHKRLQTFYDGTAAAPVGICHISMAEPFCTRTRKILYDSSKELGFGCRDTGTAVTIEGPRFSSKAESKLWRAWGGHIVNMTTVPEVVLANEVGLCYGAIALVTDYDSWRDDEESVSVDSVLKTFKENSIKAQKIFLKSIPKIAQQSWGETLKSNQELIKNNTLMPST
ncbi:hypothetical protein ScPMuIL_005514 [Solemya velum]